MSNGMLHWIAAVQDNVNGMGIDAIVKMVNHSQIGIVFKSTDDMNLYKIGGRFKEGRYTGDLYLMFFIDEIYPWNYVAF